MPIGPGRYQFPRFSIGPHRFSVIRFSSLADFLLSLFSLSGRCSRPKTLAIHFFMGLYINSEDFINFFEHMKKCSTLDGENRIGTRTNRIELYSFWKST